MGKRPISRSEIKIAQESKLCQFPIAYITEPPEGTGASIDCVIERKRKGTNIVEIWDWKTHVPCKYIGKSMATVPKTFTAIASLLKEQGFKSPIVHIESIENLSKKAGYKPCSGRSTILRDLDYLFDVSIETNVYELCGVEDGKNKPRRKRYRFHIIDSDYYDDGNDTQPSKYLKVRTIKINDIIFEAFKKHYIRQFPLDPEIFYKLPPYQMRLYQIIVNEMQSSRSYRFRVSDLQQEVPINSDSLRKTKGIIRRAMNGLIAKRTGIEDYSFKKINGSEYLIVEGNVGINRFPKKDTYQDEETVGHQKRGSKEIVAYKMEDYAPSNYESEKKQARRLLQDINFTPSHIPKYLEYPDIVIDTVLEAKEFEDEIENIGGWVRKVMDAKIDEKEGI